MEPLRPNRQGRRRGRADSGPASVPPQPAGLAAVAGSGDQRVVAYAWKLEPLGLQPGTQLAFWATAADYRPQTGRARCGG